MDIKQLNEAINQVLNEKRYANWRLASSSEIAMIERFLAELETDEYSAFNDNVFVLTNHSCPDKLYLAYFPDSKLYGIIECDKYGGGLIGSGDKPIVAWKDFMDTACYDEKYDMPAVPSSLIKELNETVNESADDEDEEFQAAMEEYELFVLEEIQPIAPTLNKLLSLLRDIGADNRADALEEVLDYVL